MLNRKKLVKACKLHIHLHKPTSYKYSYNQATIRDTRNERAIRLVITRHQLIRLI